MASPGLEPETFSVLDWRDNQLHHDTILQKSIELHLNKINLLFGVFVTKKDGIRSNQCVEHIVIAYIENSLFFKNLFYIVDSVDLFSLFAMHIYHLALDRIVNLGHV